MCSERDTESVSMTPAAWKKILAIQIKQMGDVLLTTPAVRCLRRAFPDAQIDFAVQSNIAVIVEDNPDIDNLVIVNPKSGFFDYVSFLRSVRRTGYDAVFDFIGTPRSAVIARVSGAPVRYGFDFDGRKFAYTHVVQRDRSPKYEVDYKFDLLRGAGIACAELDLVLGVNDAARARAAEIFRELGLDAPGARGKGVILLSPISRRQARRWHITSYARLASLAADAGFVCVAVTGPGEEQMGEEIVRGSGGRALMLPPTSVKEMAACFALADATVANDNGPMHISMAVGTPTIAIFGPTKPESWMEPGGRHRWLKGNVPCIGCEKQECNEMICMTDVTPEAVLAVVREVCAGQTETTAPESNCTR